jgi:hypothetical protein
LSIFNRILASASAALHTRVTSRRNTTATALSTASCFIHFIPFAFLTAPTPLFRLRFFVLG